MGNERHNAARIAAASAVAFVAGLALGAPPASPATGRIFSVAGGFFVRGSASVTPPIGDGGPAAFARLTSPVAVAATPDGGFLVAEANGHRVRRVSPRGVISTVAGTGRGGLSADGGPATAARINMPVGVAQLADGTVAIADQRNNRIALVDPTGVISTLATMTAPDGVAAAADGGVLVVQHDPDPRRVPAAPGGGAIRPRPRRDRVGCRQPFGDDGRATGRPPRCGCGRAAFPREPDRGAPGAADRGRFAPAGGPRPGAAERERLRATFATGAVRP